MAKKAFTQKYAKLGVEESDQKWLWYKRIPMGLVTLVSGVGGVGKTKALANIITTVFKQEEFPDGIFPGTERGHVVFLTTENDEIMLGKDFAAQGCTEEEEGPFIHVINFLREDGSDEDFVFDIDQDLPALTAVLDEWHPIALVIDPLREFHSRKDIDSRAVRSLMMKLNQLAKKYQLALIGVIHWNKDEKGSKSNRMAGSHQYRDGVRSVIIIDQDSKDKKTRLFIQDKMNIAEEPDDLSFTIEPPKGMVSWTPVEGFAPPTMVQECQEWLMQLLSSGPMPVKAIIDSAEYSERTVYNARKHLGLLITKTTMFMEYKYVECWELAGPENHWGLKL